jgi:pyruvate/oxaloacetate carboxyltransferase
MDQTVRDGQQSLWATRMPTDCMVPIARTMDRAGFFIVDLIGGAAIDSCVMFLREDPFERVRVMHRLMPNSRLQFNNRGLTIFRWTGYPDDVAELTTRVFARNGIRSIMVFDTLNDMRNLEPSIRFAKETGCYVIGAVVYTVSPVHTDEHFASKARQLVTYGVDAVQLKDAGGLLTPERVRTLVPLLKRTIGATPLHLHPHCTSGLGTLNCLAAVEPEDLGIDVMHGVSEPLGHGWSLPPHEDIVPMLRERGYEVPVDDACLREMNVWFRYVAKKLNRPVGRPLPYDPKLYEHQVPGGMMSNLISQLSEQGLEHRMPEVLEEIVRVRQDLGYPIMVSPFSQYVGAQAVFNVLTGERYRIVPHEVRQYALGYYGQLAAPIDPNVRDRIAGDAEPITVRPGELLEPMVDRFRAENGPFASDEELVLAIFYTPQILKEYRAALASKVTTTLATTPLAVLIQELGRRGDLAYAHVEKGGLRLTQVF